MAQTTGPPTLVISGAVRAADGPSWRERSSEAGAAAGGGATDSRTRLKNPPALFFSATTDMSAMIRNSTRRKFRHGTSDR